MPCHKTRVMEVGTVPIWRLEGEANYFFNTKMSVDADGSPRAYHPDSRRGLDNLANAGHPGNWWGVVTDNGRKDGHPVIQTAADPAPGFYVSTTSLQDGQKAVRDPHRYVDAETILFIALPPEVLSETHTRFGDFALVANTVNSRHAFAIVADQGPPHEIGEGSIALAKALGINPDARRGGAGHGIVYIVFPGSGNHHKRSLEEINTEGSRLFESWGGPDQLHSCFPQLAANEATARLTYAEVKTLVAANNKSDFSTEAIVSLIWKESSFDPSAQSSTSTATGLMQITRDAVTTVNNTTPPGVHFEHSEMKDKTKNVQCGTYYLKFLRRTFAKKEALEHFGTGPGYADNILTCETCLQASPADPQTCLNAIHT